MTKRVFLFSVINFEKVEQTISQINDFQNDPECDRILLIISSGGGDESCIALYDYIKLVKKPLDTLALGMCKSAAITVLQAGLKRYATPNTHFLIHLGTLGGQKILAKEIISNRDKYKEYLNMRQIEADRIGLGLAKFLELIELDQHLNILGALEFGVNNLIDQD